jgi:hypothetical protein
MALMMNITMILSGVNILLIALLLYVYIGNYVKMRSGFTLGLMFFAILFLIHNVLYLYFSITMMPYYAESLETFAFIFTLLQTLAFSSLTWVTWK